MFTPILPFTEDERVALQPKVISCLFSLSLLIKIVVFINREKVKKWTKSNGQLKKGKENHDWLSN